MTPDSHVQRCCLKDGRKDHLKPEDHKSDVYSIFTSTAFDGLLDADDVDELYRPGGQPCDIEERAYQILLPVVKRLVTLFKEHPHLNTDDEFRIACIVCPNQPLFRGWYPLHIHAQKYWKNFPHQHQGYYRAIASVLKLEKLSNLIGVRGPESLTLPPVLLVENGNETSKAFSASFDGTLRRWKGLQGMDLPKTTTDMQLEEVLAVFKKNKNGDRNIVVFPASEVGFVNAKRFSEVIQKCPGADASIKFKVEKLETDCEAGIRDLDSLKSRDRKAGSWARNYDKHHPLGTWATLEEIKEYGRVDSIMGKWAKGFSGQEYASCGIKWPFEKSKRLKEMDLKFQRDLQKFRSIGVEGNDKLKAKFDEIEKQMHKERLQWLKEVSKVRDQLDAAKIDMKNEERHKLLNKKLWEVKNPNEEYGVDDADSCDSFLTQVKRTQRKKKILHDQEVEKERTTLLRGLLYEETNLRKQAEDAKDERNCIQRSIEREEMLQTINKLLECRSCPHKVEGECDVCRLGSCNRNFCHSAHC